MSKKKEAAGSGHSTTAKEKSSKAIIAEPIDVVNALTNNIDLSYEDVKKYSHSEVGAAYLFCSLFRFNVRYVAISKTISKFEISLNGDEWDHERFNGRLIVEALLIWLVAKIQNIIPISPQTPRREWTEEMKNREKTDSLYRKYYNSLNSPINRSRLIRTIKLFTYER